MRLTLGLNVNHADSSACIIKDGKLLFAIEEERINREKHWAGLPVNSIKECLKYAKIKPKDITDVAINTNPTSNFKDKSFFFLKNYIFGNKKYEIVKRLKKKINIKKDLNNHLYPDVFSNKIKFHYIDHHISHIASAFYPSGFKDAIGISIDGFGDFCSISICNCKEEKIDIVKKYLFPNSLGVFYEALTQFIGFKNYGDEYKLMGLSSLGTPIFADLLMDNLFLNDDYLKLNLDFFNHTNNDYFYNFEGIPKQNDLYNTKLEILLKVKNLKTDDIKQIHKDIAASTQKVFEIKLFNIIDEAKKLKISENLVYAGGCALNSLANEKLYESNFFKNIFIPYAPGDGGGSIGAALFVEKNKYEKVSLSNLKSPYLGNKYSVEYTKTVIETMIDKKTFKVNFFESEEKLNQVLASLLAENKIVGNFNGRMEFGARALGNRSILANPCSQNIKEIINQKIKRRENFRPFAPAILQEEKNKWFISKKENPYMSSVEKIMIEKQKIIPSVTHVDGTGRVQGVTKDMNKNFYDLINCFFKITKVPILLNTSFNENEPIVMTPDQAINCFLRTEMDVLSINKFLILR